MCEKNRSYKPGDEGRDRRRENSLTQVSLPVNRGSSRCRPEPGAWLRPRLSPSEVNSDERKPRSGFFSALGPNAAWMMGPVWTQKVSPFLDLLALMLCGHASIMLCSSRAANIENTHLPQGGPI